jgi:hypothetical protein
MAREVAVTSEPNVAVGLGKLPAGLRSVSRSGGRVRGRMFSQWKVPRGSALALAPVASATSASSLTLRVPMRRAEKSPSPRSGAMGRDVLARSASEGRRSAALAPALGACVVIRSSLKFRQTGSPAPRSAAPRSRFGLKGQATRKLLIPLPEAAEAGRGEKCIFRRMRSVSPRRR